MNETSTIVSAPSPDSPGQNPVVQESLRVGERTLADHVQGAGTGAKRPAGRPRKPNLGRVVPLAVPAVGESDQVAGGLPSGAGLTVEALSAVLKTADRLNQSLLRKFGSTALGPEIEKLAAETALTDGQAETIAGPLLEVAQKYGWDLSFGPEVALGLAALPWVLPNLLLWREISARLRGAAASKPAGPAPAKPEGGAS